MLPRPWSIRHKRPGASMKWAIAAGLLTGGLGPMAFAEDRPVKWQYPPGKEPRFRKVIHSAASSISAEQGTDRERAIAEILARYRARSISRVQAQNSLRPLLKAEVTQELAGAEATAAHLRSELADVEQMIRDPGQAVERRLEELLSETPTGD